MADAGYIATDKLVKQLARRLRGVFSSAEKKAIADLLDALAQQEKFTDEVLDALGWNETQKQIFREKIAKDVLYKQGVVKRVSAEIARSGTIAAEIIQGQMTGIYTLNFHYAAYSVQQQAGVNLIHDFAIYDRNQLAIFVRKTQTPFTKIAYKNMGKESVIVTRLQNSMMEGILLGESQEKLMERIKEITGQSYRQAMRVAQTERTRVQSEGRMLGIETANKIGVRTQKKWIAHFVNTRPEHEAVHWEIVDYDTPFSNGLMFPGDPDGEAEQVINCHCTMVSEVKSVSPAILESRQSE